MGRRGKEKEKRKSKKKMNEWKGNLRPFSHTRQTQLIVFIYSYQKILPGGKEQGEDFHSHVTLIFSVLGGY